MSIVAWSGLSFRASLSRPIYPSHVSSSDGHTSLSIVDRSLSSGGNSSTAVTL
jgi:hypothetical protein